MFITFEGCEGVGKSTQLALLKDYLKRTGQDAVYVREPGSTVISEKIRAVVLDPENSAMTAETEALLYAAARAQLVSEVILPALAEGKTVICDRYVDSSVAYQGYARGLGVEFVTAINRFALENATPDITVFIDLRPVIGPEQLSFDGIHLNRQGHALVAEAVAAHWNTQRR